MASKQFLMKSQQPGTDKKKGINITTRSIQTDSDRWIDVRWEQISNTDLYS